MVKKLTLNENQSIELNSSVGWLLKYRAQFGHDILPDILPAITAVADIIIEAIDGDTVTIESIKGALDSDRVQEGLTGLFGMELVTIINIVWAMAKNANRDIEPPEEWVESLEAFPVDVIVPEVINMVLESCVSSKNLKSLQTAAKSLRA